MSGGLFAVDYDPAVYAAERDLINFAPRVRDPRPDAERQVRLHAPSGAGSRALFDLLGLLLKDKRLVSMRAAIRVWFLNEYRKDIFDFLDGYLGRTNR